MFSHLWNDLPKSERARLMPHMIESQILHIKQSKLKAIKYHKAHMKEINDLLSTLERELFNE